MGEQHVKVRGGVTNHLNTTRMNPSNLYEQYFNAASRKVKRLVTNIVQDINNATDDVVDQAFNVVLDMLSIIGTEQYTAYSGAGTEERRKIIRDIVEDEFYIYYKVSSHIRPYEIVKKLMDSPYRPDKSRVTYKPLGSSEYITTVNEVMIAPQYMIVLAKTPESYLATSSSKLNHFGLPVSVGPKIRQVTPYRNSPTKVLSETEVRLYAAYAGRRAVAEIKDRGNSVETHQLLYKNVLTSHKPTDIDNLVDRRLHPFGTDKALEFVDNVISCAGIEFQYDK